jgi:hypothetical protein
LEGFGSSFAGAAYHIALAAVPETGVVAELEQSVVAVLEYSEEG